MNKKFYAFISLMIIIVFIGYIIYDSVTAGRLDNNSTDTKKADDPPEQWIIEKELQVTEGQLTSVAVSANNDIYLGGDSFLECIDESLNTVWKLKMPGKITAISVFGDTVYASSQEIIYLVSNEGRMVSEWGPYEVNSIITSLSAGKQFVAFADAGVKRIFILKKDGEMVFMLGQMNNDFIIPSAYFDVVLTDEGNLYIANTGHRRIETWTFAGTRKGYFGEPGTAPGAFCGCCNPAHFVKIPGGFITAEKGINRIKILDENGTFIEFVSSKNSFTPSVPLDIASSDGKIIYAANPADSRLYVFSRKNPAGSVINSGTEIKTVL
ncbi:MAG: hypothetical protein JXR41_14310 [Bacteroidales bacterium]|nr:hypothetical protein [Bacteroidales bacterium]